MKIYLKLIVVTFLTLSTFSLFAKSDSTFINANKAYTQKNYTLAIQLYNEVLADGYKNADVYYNLGNAYFKNGELSKAILFYERALRLDPSNKDIQHNLAFANQKIVDEIDIIPEIFIKRWINNTIGLLSSNGWAVLSIVFLILMLSIIALMLLSSVYRKRIILFLTAVVVFILLTVSISFSFLQYKQLIKKDEAIITQLSVAVKSMPDSSGTELFTIHEGLKVSVTDAVDTWVEIALPNGNKGWIESNALEII
ncbi:MAG TPA: tetratricopeptide repeat protein [Bacteroidales bacterium]|nr:tetratricopeptide repeat protein [Bacteroidales bacterium]